MNPDATGAAYGRRLVINVARCDVSSASLLKRMVYASEYIVHVIVVLIGGQYRCPLLEFDEVVVEGPVLHL